MALFFNIQYIKSTKKILYHKPVANALLLNGCEKRNKVLTAYLVVWGGNLAYLVFTCFLQK